MKTWEKFSLTAIGCVTTIICFGLVAYAVALPRYAVTESGGVYVINDRFHGEIFACTLAERTWGCLRMDPARSRIVEAP